MRGRRGGKRDFHQLVISAPGPVQLPPGVGNPPPPPPPPALEPLAGRPEDWILDDEELDGPCPPYPEHSKDLLVT